MEIAAMILQYAILGAVGGICLAAWKLVQQYNLVKWVNWTVKAIEMAVPQVKRGMYKKEKVLEFLRAKFPRVDIAELDMLVEKAVFEINSGKKNGS